MPSRLTFFFIIWRNLIINHIRIKSKHISWINRIPPTAHVQILLQSIEITFTVHFVPFTYWFFFKMITDFAWFISSHCIKRVVTCIDISRLAWYRVLYSTPVMYLKNAGQRATTGMINCLTVAPAVIINITRKISMSPNTS